MTCCALPLSPLINNSPGQRYGPWFRLQRRARLTRLSLSSSSCSSLLLSLSEQHTALGCSLIQVISSPLCCIPLCALTRAIRRGATDLSALDRLTYAAAALGCWSELQVPTSSPPPPPPTVCLPVSCQSPTQALQQNLNCYPLRRSSAAWASYQRKAWASAVLCTSSE